MFFGEFCARTKSMLRKEMNAFPMKYKNCTKNYLGIIALLNLKVYFKFGLNVKNAVISNSEF